jgi:lactococcin 972 family bacteriocin
MPLKRIAVLGVVAGASLALTLTPTVALAASPAPGGGAGTSPEREVEVPDDFISAKTVENAEGGTWDYGVNSKDVYSNYFHGKRKHGSSVKNGDGVNRRSALVNKNTWSRVSLEKKYPGNKAYYRFSG